MWTRAELLQWTAQRFTELGLDSPRRDAEHLLAHALMCSRVELYVHHDAVVDEQARARFREYVRRRLAREPVAYIEGKRGFHALDLELAVDPRVLVPRPETEHLVDWVLEDLRPSPAPPQAVLDVGTGSGAIALAIKHARPDVTVTACDIGDAALTVARANAARSGLEVEFVVSDLLRDVAPPERGWSAIAANLPYIPTREWEALAPEVREFEPRRALDGGRDGLDVIRRLVAEVAVEGVLHERGALYLEVGYQQAQVVGNLLREHGFAGADIRTDLDGIARVVRGRLT